MDHFDPFCIPNSLRVSSDSLFFELNPSCASLVKSQRQLPACHILWLVGQGHPSEKYEFVNWDD